jgi:asparagine synthase (glutamine-hydrolysing)
MCGIAGSISTLPYSFSQSDCMPHRGPDDSGKFEEGMVKLEHRRLSIIDLSEKAHQPMTSADGNYVIIFNGEIYNHMEIRKELMSKGYSFRSTSDTESLLYGYIAFGPQVLTRLNGIFAFAIYDKKKQQVFVARDQFGIKPLYLYHNNGCFLFSSELKTFLKHPAFDKAVDINALFNYLQFLYCPTSATPFKHVKRLDPGHYQVVQLKTDSFLVQEPVKYYDIPFNGVYQHDTEQQWIETLEQALIKAVERQLLSDVPVGFFLSGGLDSSLIVALATKALNRKFTCFTVSTGEGMKEEGFSDDLLYARKVAGLLGVKMEIVEAAPEILRDFDKMIWHLDEPQADPAAIHVYNISAGARKQGIKVLLGGTAGDDLFSGYRRHQALLLERTFDLTPRFVRTGIAGVMNAVQTKQPALRRMKKLAQTMGMDKLDRLAGYFKWSQDDQIFSLFEQGVAESIDPAQISTHYHQQLLRRIGSEKNDLNKVLYWELKTFLVNHNLNYTDKMSMAAGVEARVPYLDVELVNLSTRIPPHLKMKGKTTKYLLKKVAEKYLPSEVIYRPKTGFGAPVRKWVESELKPMIGDRLSPEQIKKRGIFSPKGVEKLIRDNAEGKIDGSYQVFALLAMESWMEQFIDA